MILSRWFLAFENDMVSVNSVFTARRIAMILIGGLFFVVGAFAQTTERRESSSGDVLNGASTFSSPNASGGLGVRLTEAGDGIRLFNVPSSSGLSLRYASENGAQVNIRVNDRNVRRITLRQSGSDFDRFRTETVTLPIPSNATVTIFLPRGSASTSVDFVDFLPVQTALPSTNNDNLLRCDRINPNIRPAEFPVLRIPLAVHVGGSGARDQTVCGILEEINEIWFDLAGICFEMTVDRRFINRGNPQQDRRAEKRRGILNFWILSRGGLFPVAQNANGVFLGRVDEAYTVLNPGLSNVGVRARSNFAAARTGAHELGHALNLNHQNCGAPCANLLMTSGRRGFGLITGTPANTNEIRRARNAAQTLPRRALSNTTLDTCAAPRFIE